MNTIFTVTLPDIGEGVAEGEIVEWLKKPGERVLQDEPVVIVMTDKATVELPAPRAGTIAKHYFQPGETAPVHQPLYDIETAVVESPTIVKALPKTRALASEQHIALETITPTGKHGEVTEADLRICSKDDVRPLIGVRHLMAKKMVESKAHIPHFSYFETVDVTRLIQLRQNIQEAAASEGIHVTYMPFFIRALSLTIDKFPLINSSVDETNNSYHLHREQNIGIAFATPEGLIVPVLKNVENLKIQEIIRAFDLLKKKKYTAEDMRGSTITISNYGTLGGGGQWATPIINYPEAAILAVARIARTPLVKSDQLVIRDTLNLSWSFDHRLIDGSIAANVSHFFATLLGNPASLL